MSKFDEALELYNKEMSSKLNVGSVDADLLRAVTKSLGPVIYNEDSSRVSCSDKEELARVKKNFLIGKLGLEDSDALDAAIKEVCEAMGTSNRNKYRAIFYYMLVQKFGKEAMFAG